ncbi:isocitrate lyase/phosphoenolpyruvate mutase family protein [Lysinibacillus sp. FSL H8-0500]
MTKIQIFNDLHSTQELFFIGNAWDVLSTSILEKVGFQAIDTTDW